MLPYLVASLITKQYKLHFQLRNTGLPSRQTAMSQFGQVKDSSIQALANLERYLLGHVTQRTSDQAIKLKIARFVQIIESNLSVKTSPRQEIANIFMKFCEQEQKFHI